MRLVLALAALLPLIVLSFAPQQRWHSAPMPPAALAAPETLVVGPDTLRMAADIWYNDRTSPGPCGCAPGHGSPVGTLSLRTYGTLPISAPESVWVGTAGGTWVYAPSEWTTPDNSLFVNSWPGPVPTRWVWLRCRDDSGTPRFVVCRATISLPV